MPVGFGVYKNFRSSEFRDPALVFGDYFMFNYRITDGSDLDIRFGFLDPTVVGYLGWGANSSLSANGQTFAYWGGDNTGLGRESVYIDKAKFLLAFPGRTTIEFDLRAFWYGTVGNNPVIVNLDAFQGGTMINSNFTFINPTATNTFPSSRSFPNTLSLRTQNASTNGQRVARAVLDFDEDKVFYYST